MRMNGNGIELAGKSLDQLIVFMFHNYMIQLLRVIFLIWCLQFFKPPSTRLPTWWWPTRATWLWQWSQRTSARWWGRGGAASRATRPCPRTPCSARPPRAGRGARTTRRRRRGTRLLIIMVPASTAIEGDPNLCCIYRPVWTFFWSSSDDLTYSRLVIMWIGDLTTSLMIIRWCDDQWPLWSDDDHLQKSAFSHASKCGRPHQKRTQDFSGLQQTILGLPFVVQDKWHLPQSNPPS